MLLVLGLHKLLVEGLCGSLRRAQLRILGAHAPRVLAIAPLRSRTFPGKHVLARTPKPAREGACAPQSDSHPLRHLFRERALGAIGIILHTKIFVDLQQTLLMRDGPQKLFPARIISKKTRGSGFQSPVG